MADRAEVAVGELVPQQGELQAFVGYPSAKRPGLVHDVVDLVEAGVESRRAGADSDGLAGSPGLGQGNRLLGGGDL
ncbi:hypothetical protein RKD26_000035 [Streptomyces calvus]|uniref:hypothetical protein n=1 Tax=Streptomyces calvus TaxID=67282 RepID=UPI003519B852